MPLGLIPGRYSVAAQAAGSRAAEQPRGSRIQEDYGKFFFTIMDFKKATELFADPEFDGDPVQIYEPGPDDSPVPPEEWDIEDEITIVDPLVPGPGGITGFTKGQRTKYVVNDVEVNVVAERVQYYGKDGKLITESLRDYNRKAVQAEFASLDDFLKRWSDADRKQAVVDELAEQGVPVDALADQVGKDFDAFDLVCHVAFDQPPLTRRERAANVRKRDYFTKFGDQARAVLDALLDKYANEGVASIESIDILRVQPISELGTPVEIVKSFGGKDQYIAAVKELESLLYAAA